MSEKCLQIHIYVLLDYNDKFFAIEAKTQEAENLEAVSSESEWDLFQSFTQMSAIGIGWMDKQGNWLMVNEVLCKTSGYTEQEWLMPESVEHVLFLIEDRIVSPLEGILEGNSGKIVKLIHKKGFTELELHWNEITMPVSKISGYMVQFKEIPRGKSDLTALEQRSIKETKLARALHVNKQHYKSLFEHHPDAVFSLDLQGRFLTMNESCERITGFSSNELFQTLFINRIHTEDWAKAIEFFSLSINGKAQQFSSRVLHKNGCILELMTYFLPITVEGGVMGVYGIAKDITKEKQLLEKLRESQEMHRVIEEHSFDLIFRCNLMGSFLYISPSCNKLLGYSQDELLGTDIASLIHPDDVSNIAQQFFQQRDSEIISTLYCSRFRHKDGRFVWMESMTTLVRENISGSINGVLCVMRDISERKDAEELLLRSEKLLMAGQLAAGIAHEIRNPLTSIKGFLQLLSSQMKDKRDYVDIMKSELNRIESITSELLLLAKPHSQAFRVQEFHTLIQQVVSIMEPQAILNNVEIHFSHSEGDLLIRCDENQLKQVFVNFIKNAIEAMPSGGVVQVRLERQGDNAIVSVTDQGCGIPEEKLTTIWQPFYTTKEKGTGLGLMVSYSIIENHNGSIHVSSRTNIGTTFTVRMPLKATH